MTRPNSGRAHKACASTTRTAQALPADTSPNLELLSTPRSAWLRRKEGFPQSLFPLAEGLCRGYMPGACSQNSSLRRVS